MKEYFFYCLLYYSVNISGAQSCEVKHMTFLILFIYLFFPQASGQKEWFPWKRGRVQNFTKSSPTLYQKFAKGLEKNKSDFILELKCS